MAWLGQSVVVVTSLRYMLFNPKSGAYTELFVVSEEAPPPTMVQSVPSANQAVLLMVRFLASEPSKPSCVDHITHQILECRCPQ